MSEKRGLTDINFQTSCRDFVLDCLSLMEDSFREAIDQQGQDRFAALTDAFGAGRAMIARLLNDPTEEAQIVLTALIVLDLAGESNFGDDTAQSLVSDASFENAMTDLLNKIEAAREAVTQTFANTSEV